MSMVRWSQGPGLAPGASDHHVASTCPNGCNCPIPVNVMLLSTSLVRGSETTYEAFILCKILYGCWAPNHHQNTQLCASWLLSG